MLAAGHGVIIESPDREPSFVAYFVQRRGVWIYQGVSGWFDSNVVQIVFPQWPYGRLPLMLQGFRQQADAPLGIAPLGQSVVRGRVTSGWETPLPTPMVTFPDP